MLRRTFRYSSKKSLKTNTIKLKRIRMIKAKKHCSHHLQQQMEMVTTIAAKDS